MSANRHKTVLPYKTVEASCEGRVYLLELSDYSNWCFVLDKHCKAQAALGLIHFVTFLCGTSAAYLKAHFPSGCFWSPELLQVLHHCKTLPSCWFALQIGADEDVEKAKNSRNIRRGKGKMRNRRYVSRKGPLVIYGEDNGISKAFRNIPGVDVLPVTALNILQVWYLFLTIQSFWETHLLSKGIWITSIISLVSILSTFIPQSDKMPMLLKVMKCLCIWWSLFQLLKQLSKLGGNNLYESLLLSGHPSNP